MKTTVIFIVVGVALLAGMFFLIGSSRSTTGQASGDNASTTIGADGKQVVSIRAKGGYYPQA
jgi:hypothetical protein